MFAIYFTRISIPILLLLSLCSYGQEGINSQLKEASDSLKTNPNYTYKILSSLAKNREIHDSIQAKIKLNLASYFNDIGIPDSTAYYANSCLLHLKEKNHLAKAYRLLGSSYRSSGKIDDAIKMLLKSVKIAEEIAYTEMICMIKSDLGILYANKGDFDKAIMYMKESISIAHSEQVIYSNYTNMGSIYFKSNDLNNAEKYFLKALELLKKDKNHKVSAAIDLNLGAIAFMKKNYDEAEKYFIASKTIADAHGYETYSLNARTNLADIQETKGNFEAAIIIWQEAITKAEELSNLEAQKKIYDDLSKIHAKIGDYKLANQYIKKHHQLQDSIYNFERLKQIQELEVQYETSQKENEILLLKKDQLLKKEEIKRHELFKKLIITGFLILLVPVMIVLLVYYQKLKVQRQLNSQKEELSSQKINSIIKEQELKLSKAAITAQNEERGRIARQLHDSIGGTLAALKLQLLDTKKNGGVLDIIIEQLDDTYQQVREISHNLTPKKISETAFTSLIGEYIQNIEKATGQHINFISHPQENINAIGDTLKAEIFNILQELLTNVIKHAKANDIEICLNAYEDSIQLLFEDNGIGFDAKKSPKGIGLHNIKKRLQKLNARINIDSVLNRGTAINIDIPIAYDR